MKYLFVLLLLFSTTAQAKELKVTYGLYTGGFNVVDIVGTYDITPDQYDLQMDLKTVGLLGSLAPWSGDIQSTGKIADKRAIPSSYVFENTWRDDTQTTQFTFNDEGHLTSYKRIKEDGRVENTMPTDEVYADHPLDLLSNVFQAMMDQSCAGTRPAFDRKRRFDMVFESQGKVTMEQSKYSAFSGDAEICTIEIVPVAGKWRDKPRGWMSIQGQAKENGQLPRLWFGKVDGNIPPIPVRFQIKTNYGTMIMHLKSIDEL